MKVAIVLRSFPALSETFVLNQITGLLDRGLDVDIYAQWKTDERRVHADIEKYRLFERTRYISPMPKSRLWRVIKAFFLFFLLFHKKPMPVMRSLNFFKYGLEAASLKMFYDMRVFLDGGLYDVIHCHYGPTGNMAVMLRDIGAIEGKILTTFHGFDMTTYLNTFGNHVYDELFASGDLFLPISNRWKDKLIGLGCDEKKIVLHRMGVDTEKFKPSLNQPKRGTKIKILTVCRLVEVKGVRFGIEAVGKLLKENPGIEYTVLGDGPLSTELKHLVDDLKLGNFINLAGPKEQEEVLSFLKDADIFLAPSITNSQGAQEGVPVAIMEAMAIGLPVVSTNYSCIPELIKDGESGLLALERDVDGLADRLELLVNDPDRREKMGLAARRVIEDNFNIEKLNNQLVNLFSRLVQ